nr:MAG TPA: hypothetical protein [Caudoviricetes sp.]
MSSKIFNFKINILICLFIHNMQSIPQYYINPLKCSIIAPSLAPCYYIVVVSISL